MDNPGLQPSITPPPPATPPPVPPIPPPPPPPPPVPVEQPQIQVPVKKNLKLKKFLPLGLVMILLIGGLFLGKNLLLEKQRPVEKLAVDCGVKPDGTPLHCNDLTEVCCLTGCKPASEGCGDSPGGGETCSNESPTVTDCRGQVVGYQFCFQGSLMRCIKTTRVAGDIWHCSQDFVPGGVCPSPSPSGVCVRDPSQPNSCYQPTAIGNNCAQAGAGYEYGCGMECCTTTLPVVCCLTGCYPKDDGCPATSPSPSPSPTRPDYCVSASADKATMNPGETLTLSSVSNTPVNGFYYATYNLDNNPAGNSPGIVCTGTGTDAQCPNGGKPLIFSDADKATLRTNGSASVSYASLFITDKSTGQQATNLQFNAYFSLNGGEWSWPKPNCVAYTKMGTPTLACMALAKDVEIPTLGDEVTYTCEANLSTNSPIAFFRTSSDNGVTYSGNIPYAGVPINSTTNKADQKITIDKVGDWIVQCRVCDNTATTCTTWGQAN